jgi:hypothetical protein
MRPWVRIARLVVLNCQTARACSAGATPIDALQAPIGGSFTANRAQLQKASP